jgi:hypothetical protein
MKDIRALIIRVDGIEEKTISQDLETLQGLVGGYVESIKLSNDMTALVNNEGKMLKLPRNEKATTLCNLCEIGWHDNDFVCGTMVVVGGVDQEGYFKSLMKSLSDGIEEVLKPGSNL